MSGSAARRTVIVGGGQAGGWAAIALRQADANAEILLLGEEIHPPYERPPVSKAVLAGEAAPESAYLRSADFYEQNGIRLMAGRRVEGIDRAAGAVRVAGEWLGYDSLILATGARPRRLPAPEGESPDVFYLRTLDQALALKARLKPGVHVAIVGAGFIGLEVAAVAAKAGCRVTIVDVAPQPLARVVAPEVGAVVADMHRAKGVVFRLGTGLTELEAPGNGVRLVLSDGEVRADLAVVGIGAVPNVELAREAGLAVDNGVVVDSRGRTDDPAIWAAGDVTRHFNPLLGRSLRLESWQNAQNQAIAVAKAVAGGAADYAEVPWFWTDQYDANLQIAGVAESWDRLVWRGEPASGRFTLFYLKDGRVVAGNTLNNARDMRFIRQIVAGAKAVDAERLGNPAVALAEICRS